MEKLDDNLLDLRSDRIFELSTRFSAVMGTKIEEITSVNRVAKMLAVNAMVVAARAGEAGKGFSIVAEEFKKLSTEIQASISSLEKQARTDLSELTRVSGAILDHLRMQRLADLALNAIEIIDRNLYERSCDVRWWATDAMVVTCVEDPSKENVQEAARRLKTILSAYTVYLDLWICDASGRVISNGRPDKYPAARNLSVERAPWFIEAMRLGSGDEFVAADIKSIKVMDDAPVATYATAIREGGMTRGKPIGVLGIHFDWRPQAQAVVDGVRLSKDEREQSRVMILDQNHRVLASSDGQGALQEVIDLKKSPKDMDSYVEGETTIGYALTPGYETYKGMGWYGCIIQSHPQQ